MNWKKLRLLSVSVFMVFNAKPCAFYAEGDDYRVAFFLPFNAWNQHFESFYLTYYRFNDLSNKIGREKDRMINCLEWQQHCGNGVTAKDIYEVLYVMPPGAFPLTQQVSAGGKQKLSQNSFIRFLLRKGNEEYLSYMHFAKRSELFCNWGEDPWTEDIKEDAITQSVANMEELDYFKNCKNPFVKKRWSFVIIKQSHFGAMYSEFVDPAYDYFSKNPGKSIIDYWGWYYWRAESIADQNIAYAKCVEGSEEKLFPSIVHFISDSLNKSLKKTQDRKTRSNLFALHALNSYERSLSSISGCYQQNPNNKLLHLLVCREINKCEDWLLTRALTGFDPAMRYISLPDKVERNDYIVDTAEINDRVYARKLQALIYSIVVNPHVKEKQFWYLAGSHLAMVRGNFAMANDMMNKYLRHPKKELDLQCQVTQFLLQTHQKKQFDSEREQHLLEVFKRVEESSSLEKRELKNRLTVFSINRLKQNNRVHKAALLNLQLYGMYFDYSERPYHDSYSSSWITYLTEYGDGVVADSLVWLMNKSKKSPFEIFLLDSLYRDTNGMNSLKEWTGSLYLREQQYEKAAQVLKKVNPEFWKVTDGYPDYNYYMNQNPFYARDDHNHGTNRYDTIRYNKYTFALRAIALKKIASGKGPKAERAALGLAHAVFSMTTHGNSWVIARNSWQMEYTGNWEKWGHNFYGCEAAFEAYKKVFETAKDYQVQATSCLMMAVCKKYNYYYREAEGKPLKDEVKPYLDLFFKRYAESKVFLERTSNCGADLFYERIALPQKKGNL